MQFKYVFVAFFALVIPLNAMFLDNSDGFTSDPTESPEQRMQREQKDYEELFSMWSRLSARDKTP